MAFKYFFSYKRTAGRNINDFLVCYKFLYQNLHKFENTSSRVHAFFVLNAANVSEINEKLTRTTCAILTYTPMKDTLKKVFSDISSQKTKLFLLLKRKLKQ